ncbi:hypothetical protein Poli38472_006657 [Pythium oligandrum]|uniref:Cyclin-like domain-containing protein n=1 Tax=Pythium oligandrum TaxID=41045 RepID=A0A8K1C507_PYTOL|nr:hypothetical protein Poli38472_006657 [Pythium oligandrum]|eukprot:TMW56647.1 hypothetical protein Poli38472_006657 [Pythium oligandrum]
MTATCVDESLLLCDEQADMTACEDFAEEHLDAYAVGVCPIEMLEMRLIKERETIDPRNPQYLEAVQESGMCATWRYKMCRWMFETGHAFELSVDTVGCAIHFLDQYLSQHSVDKIMMQLVSMVCMFVASKMHETQPISMEEMELLCERKFTRDQILKAESKLLLVLNWNLNPPVAFTYARDIVGLLEAENKNELSAPVMDLLQAATEDFSSVTFAPSVMGLAAIQVLAMNGKKSTKSAIRDLIIQFQIPADELMACFRYLRAIYIQRFAPKRVEVPEIVTAPEVVNSEANKGKTSPRELSSPTSVDELPMPKSMNDARSSIDNFIVAKELTKTSTSPTERPKPAAAKRLRMC